MTDGEMKICGTMHHNYIYSINKANVKRAISFLANADQNSFKIIQAIVSLPAKGPPPRGLRTSDLRSQLDVMQNVGFVVCNDKKDVIFFSTDFNGTLSEIIVDGCSPEGAILGYGLEPVICGTGEQNLHRNTLNIPSTVAAYNLFMNGVNHIDQLRATLSSRRKEQRISLSLFCRILDLPINKGFDLYKSLRENNVSLTQMNLTSFKRCIIESLIRMSSMMFSVYRMLSKDAPTVGLF